MAVKDALAIVGIGLRLPGGCTDAKSFWQLLIDGVDAITDMPEERVNLEKLHCDRSGIKSTFSVTQGGVVEGYDKFDQGFFNVSLRECYQMDPQQRLLLQVSWEALEDAGLKSDDVDGSNTGVFVGMSSHDFSDINLSTAVADVYSLPGSSASIAANRISFVNNLKGPSSAFDTACSSGLTAFNFACNSIISGECEQAIIANVNFNLNPIVTMGFSIAGMISDRCRAFDESANGFVRSEGAVAVVVKPLSEARTRGDDIYAIVRSTGINQDGKTVGITLPSEEAQTCLMKHVCEKAGIDPNHLSYIEAHGTGTAVGDPIEANSIGNAYCGGRETNQPLYMGSAKTNVGHLEAGAGLVGLVKAALVTKYKLIPPNLHYNKPNPKIDFEGKKLFVPSEVIALPKYGKNYYIAVNSFGFGGANANVVLEHEPDSYEALSSLEEGSSLDNGVRLVPLSAHSKDSLRQYTENFKEYLESETATTLDRIAYSSIERRNHYRYRNFLLASDTLELKNELDKLVNKDAMAGLNAVTDRNKPLVFVFSGQGPQWWGMGRLLLEKSSQFRAFMEEFDEIFSALSGWKLTEELLKDEASSNIDHTNIAQPAIFALQVGIYRYLESYGIRPSAVVGHSVGEVAAMYVSGIYSFEDAVKLIYLRSDYQEKTRFSGKMLAVSCPEERLLATIDSFSLNEVEEVSIAAINSSEDVVVAGAEDTLLRIQEVLQEKDIHSTFLKVDYPFHCKLMEPIKDEFLQAISESDLKANKPVVPCWSTVTSCKVDDIDDTSEYWWQNVREAVLFAPTICNLIDESYLDFVEISAHPVLSTYIKKELSSKGKTKEGIVVSTLNRKGEDDLLLLKCVGNLYQRGQDICFPHSTGRQTGWCKLPKYPWDYSSYWPMLSSAAYLSWVDPQLNPMMRFRKDTPNLCWESYIGTDIYPFLSDHRIEDRVVVPAAAYLDIMIAAASFGRDKESSVSICDIKFMAPMVIGESNKELSFMSIEIDDRNAGNKLVSVHGRKLEQGKMPSDNNIKWQLKSTGEIETYVSVSEELLQIDVSKRELLEGGEKLIQQVYERLESNGIQYGETFRGIKEVYFKQGVSLARISCHENISGTTSAHRIHPSLLDASFHAIAFSLIDSEDSLADDNTVALPMSINRLRYLQSPDEDLWVKCCLKVTNQLFIEADIRIFDSSGNLCLYIEGLRCQRISSMKAMANYRTWSAQYVWREPKHAYQKNQSVLMTEDFGLFLEQSVRNTIPSMIELKEREDFYLIDQANQHIACLSIYVEVLEEIGMEFIAGNTYKLSEFMNSWGVLETYHLLIKRYLSQLQVEGVVDFDGEIVKILLNRENFNFFVDSSYVEKTVLARMKPERRDVMRDLFGVSKSIPDIIVGKQNVTGSASSEPSIETSGSAQASSSAVESLMDLFDGREGSVLSKFYESADEFLVYNQIVRLTIEKIVCEFSHTNKCIDILEIGGGTGGTTAHVLPVLSGKNVRYRFTDISSFFLGNTGNRFKEYDFVEFDTLDISKDITEQGFEAGSFDIIVASNIFHATPVLRETLSRAKELLAPGGALIFVETTKAFEIEDITFALFPSYWSFEDFDLRANYPLVSKEKWVKLLDELNYQDIVAFNEFENSSLVDIEALHHVFICRKPISEKNNTPVNEQVPSTQENIKQLENGEGLTNKGCWIAVGGSDPYTLNLIDNLKQEIEQPSVVVVPGVDFEKLDSCNYHINFQVKEHWDALFESVIQDYGHIHYLNHFCACAMIANSDKLAGQDVLNSNLLDMEMSLYSLLHMVQSLSQWEAQNIRLRFIFKQLHFHGEDTCASWEHLTQSPLWGFGRTIVNEHPGLDCKMIDIDEDANIHSFLAQEIMRKDKESEVCIRDGERKVIRLTPLDITGKEALDKTVDLKQNNIDYRLTTNNPGMLEELHFQRIELPSLNKDEIKIKVHASALNFRDVLKSMGTYPEDGTEIFHLGDEFSGEIIEVGSDVRDFSVGDKVFGIASNCFSSTIVLGREYQEYIYKIPESMSHQQAVTKPIVYLTVFFALKFLAKLSEKDTILIHSAAGGVGLAAINYAQSIGAEIIVTAGNEEKVKYLESLGIEHIFDSHSLQFNEDIKQLTQGRGVDVVLNSLSGEAIPKSIELMAEFGRFIEIGKRDIYANSKIGLWPFRKNVAFFALDLSRLLDNPQKNEQVELKTELREEIEGDIFKPIYSKVFPINEIKNAFRYMSTGKHMGKIVIDHNIDELLIRHQAVNIKDVGGAHLIVGGLGGFGFEIAKWLASKGAEHLVLMGRSAGELNEEQEEAISLMEKYGTRVTCFTGDASVSEDVKNAVESASQFFPLKGIVHCGMVLRDNFIIQMSEKDIQEVMYPKINAAIHLHEHTQNINLDYMVLFSSVASIFGSPGQANYVAANYYLDMLSHYRRSNNMPCTTINWGYISEVGYLSRNEELENYFSQAGFLPITPKDAVAIIDGVLSNGHGQVTICPADKNLAYQRFPMLNQVKYEEFFGISEGDVGDDIDLNSLLMLDRDERFDAIRTIIHKKVIEVFGLNQDEVGFDTSLEELGVDSLLAVELRNWVHSNYSVELSVIDFVEGISINSLSKLITDKLEQLKTGDVSDEPDADITVISENKMEFKEKVGETA